MIISYKVMKVYEIISKHSEIIGIYILVLGQRKGFISKCEHIILDMSHRNGKIFSVVQEFLLLYVINCIIPNFIYCKCIVSSLLFYQVQVVE